MPLTPEQAQDIIAKACQTHVIWRRQQEKFRYCRFEGFEFQLNLLKRGDKKTAGFFFYSDVNVFEQDAKSKVKGPWLQSLLPKHFSANEYSLPKPKKRRHTNSKERQKGEEGHIVRFYLDDFDWENLNKERIDRIRALYAQLLKFQGQNQLANSQKVAEAIQTYNKENPSEVTQYLEDRKQTANSRTVGVNDGADQNKKIGTPTMNKEIQALLKANLNVILTGAPGTGKTYMAKEVAKKMAKDEWIVEEMTSGKKTGKWKNGRIASVQFHPGYDYSDFVVGMKPVLFSADTCKEVFRDENGIPFTRDTGKKDGERTVFSRKTEVSFRWVDGIFKKFADDAQKAFDAWVATDGHKPEDAPKYVFLIDEINRADLSRVFGELFSLLEEEYRYPNDKGTGITLPNGEYFVIPRNLYILGTMNDIDRSVESMDFALRRRFAWKEVKAIDTRNDILDALDKNGNRKIAAPAANKLKDAMQKLNDVIGGAAKLKLKDGTETDLRLGTAYQLGGAIFAKFEKCDGVFDALWDNHISNVLGEYLRGHRYRDDILIALRGIFDDAIKEGNGEKSSEKTSEAPTAPTGQQAAP